MKSNLKSLRQAASRILPAPFRVRGLSALKLLLLLAATLPYQNCTEGFKAQGSSSALLSSQVPSTPAPSTQDPFVSDFAKFQKLMSTNCYSCHANFKDLKTLKDWELAGGSLFTAGKPEESKVYTRLALATLGQEMKNMPPAAAGALTQAEADFIREFIKALPVAMPPAMMAANPLLTKLDQSCAATGEGSAFQDLTRLTDFELRNTLRDLFGSAIYSNLFNARTVTSPVNNQPITVTDLDNLPPQSVSDSLTTYYLFRKGSNSINRDWLITYDNVIFASTQKIKNLTATQRTQYFQGLDDCYVDANLTDLCVDAVVNSFGTLAYRRPLRSDEVAQIKSLVSGETTALNRLVYSLYSILIAPDFIYHLEINGTEMTDKLLIDQYAIAARISYLITGSMPDRVLLNKAKSSQLNSAVEISTEIDRLVASYPDQVKATAWNFTQEWLRLGLTNYPSSPRTNAIAAGFLNIGAGEGEEFRRAALAEMQDMISYYYVDKKGTFSDLLLSDASFAKNTKIAQAYGLAPWSGGTAEPPRFPAAQRPGILTRAAMTVRGGSRNNPFVTGGTIYKHVLCRQFGTTSGANSPEPIDPSVIRNTRQHYEAIVPRGSSCMSCHGQMEPFGMPFESFDIFSRPRNGSEGVYADNGSFLATVPINTSHTPTLSDRQTNVVNAADLVQKIDASKEAHTCFAIQVYKNNFGRPQGSADACTISRMAQKSISGSLLDVLKSLASDSGFRVRRLR